MQRIRKGLYHPQEKQVSHTWLPSFWVTTSLGLRQAQWQIINFHGYNLETQMFVEGESGKNGINVLALIKNKLQVCFHAASVILWIKCKHYKIHRSSCVTDGNVDTFILEQAASFVLLKFQVIVKKPNRSLKYLCSLLPSINILQFLIGNMRYKDVHTKWE